MLQKKKKIEFKIFKSAPNWKVCSDVSMIDPFLSYASLVGFRHRIYLCAIDKMAFEDKKHFFWITKTRSNDAYPGIYINKINENNKELKEFLEEFEGLLED